jgi:hypothetical protein
MPPPSAARRLWRSSISKRQPLEAPSGVSNEPIGRVGGSLIGCLGPCIVEVAETGPSIVQVARGLVPVTGIGREITKLSHFRSVTVQA